MWTHFYYNEKNEITESDKPIIIKDNNFDGKPDEWHFANKKRQIVRIEKDTDNDGKVDKVEKL